MPTTMALVRWMVSEMRSKSSMSSAPMFFQFVHVMSPATMTMRRAMARMKRRMEFMISEEGRLYFFALEVSLLR